MAHGGIAQAGKVKGQTPKVDKDPGTKKRPTGRARMRLKYGRLLEREASKTRFGPNKNKKE